VLSPIRPPALLAGVGRVHLNGVPRGSCWTQRSGKLRCDHGETTRLRPRDTVPVSGIVRVVAAYPIQPKKGTLTIATTEGRKVRESTWTDELRYELVPGVYVLRAEARYPRGAYVRVDFPFRVS
jgi:hypothetical protein